MIKTIAFDGDDTLWEHENFFTEVKDRFKDIILYYTDQTGVRDKITHAQVSNLNIFGYGVKGFTISMVETAIEVTDGKISAEHIQELINLGKTLLQHPIVLLKNVSQTIKTLYKQNDYKLFVITKGELFAQESKLERSGLLPYMDVIEIVSEKDVKTYDALLKKHQITPSEFLMIGNSIKSDILPVLELGSQAIHIPFHTTWVHEHVELAATDTERFLMLETMADLLPILQWHKQNLTMPLAIYPKQISATETIV